ncbi:uncharacterized protein LOC129582642 [Paramacrobiotus metropolitanus]|uniref:uncharacterized protein LOC129582642 n=1 Tax=Paramacrobiotus metropolitanus TaxID=2943436 RepID=UPI0024461ECA|nr:uncharacterized protein LOC129582642 [Paramacrobiotus metropolitanus]
MVGGYRYTLFALVMVTLLCGMSCLTFGNTQSGAAASPFHLAAIPNGNQLLSRVKRDSGEGGYFRTVYYPSYGYNNYYNFQPLLTAMLLRNLLDPGTPPTTPTTTTPTTTTKK